MHFKVSYKKYLAVMLIPALLSCGGPARKQITPQNHHLTASQATDVDWGRQKMQLVGIDGTEYIGTLLGWMDTGFIMQSKNGIEVLPYDSLRNYMQMDTGGNYSNEGFYISLAAVIGITVLLSWLSERASNKNNDNIGRRENAFGPIYILPMLAVYAIIISPTYFGPKIGSKIKKYDKYYFNADDFKSHPYFYRTDDVINKSEKDLP